MKLNLGVLYGHLKIDFFFFFKVFVLVEMSFGAAGSLLGIIKGESM